MSHRNVTDDLDAIVAEQADGQWVVPFASPTANELDIKGILALLHRKRERGDRLVVTDEELDHFRPAFRSAST